MYIYTMCSKSHKCKPEACALLRRSCPPWTTISENHIHVHVHGNSSIWTACYLYTNMYTVALIQFMLSFELNRELQCTIQYHFHKRRIPRWNKTIKQSKLHDSFVLFCTFWILNQTCLDLIKIVYFIIWWTLFSILSYSGNFHLYDHIQLHGSRKL